MTNFLEELFGSPTGLDAAQIAAMAVRMDAEAVTEAARISTLKATMAVMESAPRCSRCGGTGMLTQFMHRANGVCFGCGGTGRA